MVLKNKKLHQFTVDELEHLRCLNMESLDSPEGLEVDEWNDRSSIALSYDKVMLDPTTSTLSRHKDVMHELETHMEDQYYETSKERSALRGDLIAAGHIKVNNRKPVAAKPVQVISKRFTYNDGGRSAAGYRGHAGDCVCRSICIAAELPYKEVYARLAQGNASQRRSKKAKAGIRSARNGIYVTRKWFKDYMRELGFVWTSTMGIGTGCTVHYRNEEMPRYGRLVVSLSGHYSCMIDGVIHDVSDPSREGNRCVYGYWIKAPSTAKAIEKQRLKDAIKKTKKDLADLESQLARL